MIQLLLSVALRPPEPRMLHGKLLELLRRELQHGEAGRKSHIFGQVGRFERCRQRSMNGGIGCILEGYADYDIRVTRIGERQRRDDLRISDLHRTRRFQLDLLPDSRLAVADRGNPIPTLGSNKRRPIQTHDPAIFAGSAFDGLLLWNAGMRRRKNFNGQNVFAVFLRLPDSGDIEDAANERAGDGSEATPVEPDDGSVIDSLKGKCEVAAVNRFRRLDLGPIPILLLVQTFRNG